MGRLLAALLVVAWLLGCARPQATGDAWEITVLADSSRHAELAPLLDQWLAESWICPRPERRISWRWGNATTPDLSLSARNLLILHDGVAGGPVAALAERLMDPALRDRVRKEESFWLRKPQAFASGQLLVIAAAPGAASFRRQFLAAAQDLRQAFVDHEEEKARSGLRSSALQQSLEDSLALACGFRLAIPQDWFIIQGAESPAFIRFRALRPDRWITVHWVDGLDSLAGEASHLLAQRQALGQAYLDTDISLPQPLELDTLRLNGLAATRLAGLWESPSLPGASFLFHAVHVPGARGLSQGRTFYIDAAVARTEGPWSPSLHELVLLVSTFAGTNAEGSSIGPLQPEEEE